MIGFVNQGVGVAGEEVLKGNRCRAKSFQNLVFKEGLMERSSTLSWKEERVYRDSQNFLADLESAIRAAESSIAIEVYIFEKGRMGDELLELLSQRAKEGLQVRLLVDGVGSMEWLNKMADQIIDSVLEVRVYHPVPWPFGRFRWPDFYRIPRALKLLEKANRRNHKKVFIIDGKAAFVGSPNVTDNSLKWHETGLYLEGDGIKDLVTSFNYCWTRSHLLFELKEPNLKYAERTAPSWKIGLVRTNETRRRRHYLQKDLVRRLRAAQKFIYITTPYFVPPQRILSALCWAASRGVEVKLLLSGPTDVKLLKWVTPFFYKKLFQSGVAIYEYSERILHSKIVLIDDFVLVGSSNMNHRSFFQDIEVDVLLKKEESREILIRRFEEDLKSSMEIGENQLARFNVARWVIAKIVLFWKRSL